MRVFADRADAGRQLAERLGHLRGQDAVVLGLPRGGVPVAFQVAVALQAPLDVIVVRKLGLPYQPELAMGAIGEDGCGFSTATYCRGPMSGLKSSARWRNVSSRSCGNALRSCVEDGSESTWTAEWR